VLAGDVKPNALQQIKFKAQHSFKKKKNNKKFKIENAPHYLVCAVGCCAHAQWACVRWGMTANMGAPNFCAL
jgi:hypothetical protein